MDLKSLTLAPWNQKAIVVLTLQPSPTSRCTIGEHNLGRMKHEDGPGGYVISSNNFE